MSYTPTEWDNGDVITAAKLNKIEQGISEVSNSSGSGGGLEPLIVTFTVPLEGPAKGDKTLGEIFEAASSGRTVIGKLTVPAGHGGGEITNVLTLLACSADGNSYTATFATAAIGEVRLFENNGAASKYPSISMQQ